MASNSVPQPRDFALIIGAMKSGTTSLFRYLSQHPQIAPCKVKEPNFFADEKLWHKGMDWYRGHWAWDAGRHKVALEATSHYAKRPYIPNVPERIAEVADAEFRFIYLMRHPLERLESHDLHLAMSEVIPPLDVMIPQRTIWASQYAMQLDAYRRLFGRDRILLLLTEDLKQDPHSVMRQVCQFLRVDPEFSFHALQERHNTRERYIYQIPGFLKRLTRNKLVKRLSQTIPPRPREALRRRLARRVEVPESRFRLQPRQREYVLGQLLPDLRRLKAEYGVDVEARWGIPLGEPQAEPPVRDSQSPIPNP